MFDLKKHTFKIIFQLSAAVTFGLIHMILLCIGIIHWDVTWIALSIASAMWSEGYLRMLEKSLQERRAFLLEDFKVKTFESMLKRSPGV